MSNAIALGYGFYDLEEDFRWTSDKFSIHILDESIQRVLISIRCNKLYDNYEISYSIDNWVTLEKAILNDGINIIDIQVNGTKEIKFKCSSFVPSNLGGSSDSRILGIQFLKIIEKRESTIFEINISNIKNFSETSGDSTYYIGESTGEISLGTGWHELEPDGIRWSTGNGELNINTDKYISLKLGFLSRKTSVLRIILNENDERTHKIHSGYNEVTIDIMDIKKIRLISESFCPKDIEPYSKDGRQLGIQLKVVTLINKIDNIDISIKNLFFDHDVPQLKNFIKKYSFVNDNIKKIGGFGDIFVNNLKDIEGGKLDINDQLVFFSHRSGWSFVVNALLKYNNSKGVRFEGFLESPFIWNRKRLIDEGKLPFKCSWVGFLHNPWTFPVENHEHVTSEDLVKSMIFKKSLETCKGLYVLSKNLADNLSKEVNVPVQFLYHPTEFVNETFSVEKFEKNKHKKILEVGSWLRKVNSLYLLHSDKKIWEKIRIIPALSNFEKIMNKIKQERERYKLCVTNEMQSSVKNISPLSDKDYDEFLTKNVVFLDMYASSANNAIIECIVRGTPILINKLPAIVEYLGKDYPFYFDCMEEASEKINNMDLIKETNYYLMNKCPTRESLKIDTFLHEFENGEIFKSL